MANFRRRRAALRTKSKTDNKWTAEWRKRCFGWHFWLGSWPAWHDILHHRRPTRRRAKALERAVRLDRIDADEVAWPLSKRPHHYYW